MGDALTQGQDLQQQNPHHQQHQAPQAVAGVPRLFVGQVPGDKQEQDLFPIFSAYGTIEKLSIVRGVENKSRGCAMVEYKSWSDAENAMDSLHGTNPFDSGNARQLVVHFANPRRSAGGQNSESAIAPRKLFVGQIPKTSTEDTLMEVFSKFGVVENINILKSRGIHAGCAFVQFAKWTSCEAAIEALHEKMVMPGCEHTLVVKFADAKRSDAPGPGVGRRNGGMMGMMMGGPPHPGMMGPGGYDLASMGIAAAMGHHHHHHMALASMPMPGMPSMGSMNSLGQHSGLPLGGPMSLGYPRSRGGLSSGDGGSSDSLADRGSSADGGDGPSLAPLHAGVPNMLALAPELGGHHPSPSSHHSMGSTGSMNNLQGLSMPGMAPFTPYQGMEGAMHHMMRPGRIGRGVADPNAYAHKLFVGQIPFDASEQDLWPLFSPLGDVLELTVLRSQGKSKGCAFLTYGSPTQAATAISALNGRHIGPTKKLVVKYADVKKN